MSPNYEPYLEYVNMLARYFADSVGEVNAGDAVAWELYPDETEGEDYERSFAWSYAFERNDEARMEMEAQDVMGFT